MYTPVNPQFYYMKVGCKGVFVTRTCFRDGYFAYLQSIRIEILLLLSAAKCDPVLFVTPYY